MKNKVLFVVTSNDKLGPNGENTGYYLSEVSHVYKPIVDAGYKVDFVSPQGGTPPVEGYNMKDSVNKWFVEKESAQESIRNSMKPSEVNIDDYAAIYFAGGHGVMWDFPNNERLGEITAKLYEAGGIVAAICHGPAAFINVKLSTGEYLVNGKNISAFTDEEEKDVGLDEVVPFLLASKLEERGANLIPAKNWAKQVVVDGTILTGQNPASAEKLGNELVKMLKELEVFAH